MHPTDATLQKKEGFVLGYVKRHENVAQREHCIVLYAQFASYY